MKIKKSINSVIVAIALLVYCIPIQGFAVASDNSSLIVSTAEKPSKGGRLQLSTRNG